MAMFVENVADHFGPRVKKHVVPEGRRPVGDRKARPFAGDETADKTQRKRRAGQNDSETMGPNAHIPRILHGTAGARHETTLMSSARGSGSELLVLRQPV